MADTGFKDPTTTGTPQNEFTDPTNAYSSDDSWATETTHFHIQSYATFDFGVPAGATIDGIEVKVEGYGTTASQTNFLIKWWCVSDGVFSTENSAPSMTDSDVVYTLGGSADLWDRTPVVDDFSNANFYLNIQAVISSGTLYIDHIQVKVYYTPLSSSSSSSSSSFSSSSSSSSLSSSSSSSSFSSSSSSSSSFSSSSSSSSLSSSSSSLSSSSSSLSSSSSSSSSSSLSSSSSSSSAYPAAWGIAWGELDPDPDETAESWATWSNGAGGSPTILGDADWGRLFLGKDVVAHSPVHHFNALDSDTTLTKNKYGPDKVGSFEVYYRESDASFNQDDGAPGWNLYTNPVRLTKAYRQVKLVGE